MLEANPDVAAMHGADPHTVTRFYNSLRTLNPTFAKDPVVAGSYMRSMMEDPSRAGHQLVQSLAMAPPSGQTPWDNVQRAGLQGLGKSRDDVVRLTRPTLRNYEDIAYVPRSGVLAARVGDCLCDGKQNDCLDVAFDRRARCRRTFKRGDLGCEIAGHHAATLLRHKRNLLAWQTKIDEIFFGLAVDLLHKLEIRFQCILPSFALTELYYTSIFYFCK
jgi:hypothetical protein